VKGGEATESWWSSVLKNPNTSELEEETKMTKRKVLLFVGALFVAVLLFAAGYVLAGAPRQGLESAGKGAAGSEAQASLVDTGFWYQGLLTDQNSDPIEDADVKVGFRLYDTNMGGEALATVTITVNTDEHGLFNEQVDFGDASLFDGQGLWVGVQVSGDDEMAPRHQLRPVPYALSLRPGAIISRTSGSGASLTLSNSGTGPALSLEGSGRLQSSARSYFFVPGSMGWVRDTTVNHLLLYRSVGGQVRINRDSTGTSPYIIPIALPGHLYGQNVTIEEVRVYYYCSGDMCASGGSNTHILETILYRAKDSSGFEIVASDTTDRYSEDPQASYALEPDYTIGTSSDYGVLTLELYLSFGDDDDYIRIQGIRIMVRHE
jgi:hypothetical protein